MDRFLAIVFLILFFWVAIPHIIRGEWFAPTLAPSANHWAYQTLDQDSRNLIATPPEGVGLFRFDFWNNPPAGGRSVTKADVTPQTFWR